MRGRREQVSLDVGNACLRRGARNIPLRPKDFTILQFLIAHQGQLVTKDALLAAAWPNVFVSDAVLKVAINRLRVALGDDARVPRFIETRHRRGYRLTGTISVVGVPRPHARKPAQAEPPPEAGPIVGREAEIAQLDEWFTHAAGGRRHVAFVRGEAGLGKTALVDLLLSRPTTQRVKVGRGQCVEQHGPGEAYLPLFDALGRLCRGRGGLAVRTLLARHAPSWLAQMPGVVDGHDVANLTPRPGVVTRDRMLREIADAVDALASHAPLVLVVEDLQWSDPSTLDALAMLARRQERARLFILGTYRPEETLPAGHPLPTLIRELRLHRLCTELSLPLLPEAAVEQYLHARCPGAPPPAELGPALHHRTDGHPLFLVAMTDHLMAGGWLVHAGGRWNIRGGLDVVEREVPAGIRQMIEARLDRLPPEERRLVEAASVAGMDWSAASVAAALDEPLEAIDDRCALLARRRRLLREQGETIWPDGTAAGQYGFVHALYREVIYAQMPVARRREAHRRVALREESGYGPEAIKLAARLAMHFEQAHDEVAAVRYRLHAARNALVVGGFQEVIGHATTGLALLPRVLDGLERNEQELGLQLLLGMAAATTQGFAAAEAERAYGRAWELSRDAGRTPAAALVGLYAYHLMRGRIPMARQLAEQMLDGASRDDDAAPILWGRMALGITQMHQGEASAARASFEDALALHDSRQRAAYAAIHPLDLSMVCLVHVSWCLWVLGYPIQAAKCSRAAIGAAAKTAQPADRACATAFASFLYAFLREGRRARDAAAAAVRLSAEHGLHQWWAPSLITHGWGRAALGDVAGGLGEMRQGIDAWRRAGAEYALPIYLAMLADVLGRDRQIEEACTVLTEALQIAQTSGDRFWEPEIHRIRGNMLLTLGPRQPHAIPDARDQGTEALERALALARVQQTRGLELRAAVSLYRAAKHGGKEEEARSQLAEVYDWFREGFETRDLREARALLAAGSG
ncbi:MAG: hypothetical protein A3I61_12300 [Acidobacteria bacterium RIFCSPLOWO2_02_FULL_68_18]|nr:MAG: hypothetical protein A3I61_12300 [Acidobacteria bacterium RIFCSPLOWO2_02_FULL_68_18]OFW50830.1 MAG: hypothetical protein A3G77_16720 [Acidobacteria bacterium RIFCSPLOWO2_12_FULL_68_19]